MSQTSGTITESAASCMQSARQRKTTMYLIVANDFSTDGLSRSAPFGNVDIGLTAAFETVFHCLCRLAFAHLQHKRKATHISQEVEGLVGHGRRERVGESEGVKSKRGGHRQSIYVVDIAHVLHKISTVWKPRCLACCSYHTGVAKADRLA